MAQQVQVILVDDLDGGKATETVTFALDGVTYEIDLSDKNAAKLRDTISSWAAHGRRVGGRSGSRGTSRRARVRGNDVTAVREWGRKNGFTVSERGRISRELQTAYDKAN
jgi:hypothetical protein